MKKPTPTSTPEVSVEIVPATESSTPVPARPFGAHLTKKLALAPVTVEGKWEAARKWRDMAARAEEVKLFCQVMLGFELMHLRESHGETRGQFAVRDGKVPFSELAQVETGLGTNSIFKLIRMAEASVPQLKKLPKLRGFDPSSQAIGLLPAPQQKALSKAVRKLTDGMTQTDFLVELGIWKAPQGSGAKGGARERKPRTALGLEEQAAQQKELARQTWQEVRLQLRSIRSDFCFLEDEEVKEQIAFLDALVKARRLWLSKILPERSVRAVEAVLPEM